MPELEEWLMAEAEAIAERAADDLDRLVAISSPFGDQEAHEEIVRTLLTMIPTSADYRRLPSSSPECGQDLVVELKGSGQGQLLFLGHCDTVIPHPDHKPLACSGDLWSGTGVYDMKGGLALAAGLLRALAKHPELYERIVFLVVGDEEHRLGPLKHSNGELGEFNACLCFEGGDVDSQNRQIIIVRRRGAYTLNVSAEGKPAHAAAPERGGHSALLALAKIARRLDVRALGGEELLSITPTILRVGEAINMTPARGVLECDLRAFDIQTARNARTFVPPTIDGVDLNVELIPRFPAMDTRRATRPILEATGKRLDQTLVASTRGSSSDAAYFATSIPMTVCGLGPVGGSDHGPQEYILGSSFGSRATIALALTLTILEYYQEQEK